MSNISQGFVRFCLKYLNVYLRMEESVYILLCFYFYFLIILKSGEKKLVIDMDA